MTMNPRQRRSRRLDSTAHHEAGHAIAAWYTGLKFRYVTFEPAKDSLGHMLHGKTPAWFHPDVDLSDRVRHRNECHIVVSLAGHIAESKFLGKHPRYGMESDDYHAIDMADYLDGSSKTRTAFLHYCWSQSDDLMVRFSRQVKAVAVSLLKHRKLGFADVIALTDPRTFFRTAPL
jgi:ATP-dependent Zn protease